MLLRLTLTVFTAFAVLLPALTQANSCHSFGFPNEIPTPRFSRVIVFGKHAPASASVPGLDPNHSNAIASGLITAQEAEDLTNDGIADFIAKFGQLGVDILNATPDANGQRMTTEVLCQPFLIGLDRGTVLLSDSANPLREHLHSWFLVDYSQMFFFRTSGVVTDGAYAGLTYNAGDVFAYGYSNLLRNGANWSKSWNREKFKTNTTILSKSLTNIFNKRQFLISFDIVDSNNNQGYWLQGTSIAPENGVDYLQSRIVMTWDCPQTE